MEPAEGSRALVELVESLPPWEPAEGSRAPVELAELPELPELPELVGLLPPVKDMP